MFKLNNLYNNAPLEIEVAYNNVSILFNINTIINKRNKDEIDANKQFVLLEAYLDYKGEEFKTALMNEYIKVDEVLSDNIGRIEIMPLPYDVVNGILDLMDLEDVYHFIKNVHRYQVMRSIPDEFDDKIIKDGHGTRVQTYIKDDYLQLIAFVQVLKSIIGPIGQFGYMNSTELGKTHNHYVLFNFITQHKISKSAPYLKLYGLVDMIIQSVSKSEDETLIRVIEKRLPSDEIVVWVLSIVMMQKIAMATIVDDTDSKNVVTRAYNFVNNKLKVKGDTSNAIRSKRPMVDSESGDGDPESILESYRIISELPKGFIVEMDYYHSKIKDTPELLDVNIDKRIVGDASSFVQKLVDARLSKAQITLLGWIFKDILDPRDLEYVKLNTILALMSVGFAYLWQHNFKYLALLLTAMKIESDDAIVINFTTNRSRVTKELKDDMDKFYPFKKIIVSSGTVNREVNLADNAINVVADEIYKHRWIFTANNEYIIEATNSMSSNVPADLKIQLAELIKHINLK